MHAMEEKEEWEERRRKARDGEHEEAAGGEPPPPPPLHFAPGDLVFAGRPREWHPREVAFNQPGR